MLLWNGLNFSMLNFYFRDALIKIKKMFVDFFFVKQKFEQKSQARIERNKIRNFFCSFFTLCSYFCFMFPSLFMFPLYSCHMLLWNGLNFSMLNFYFRDALIKIKKMFVDFFFVKQKFEQKSQARIERNKIRNFFCSFFTLCSYFCFMFP